MIRHTVLFKWTEQATDEQVQEAHAQLAKLPSLVASVREFALGSDAGLNQGNFDFAVTADFDDEAGYLAYRDDPGHREIVTRYIAPILGERAAIQFQY
jgi:Stress responsive A/B Barrel Domain